MAASSFRRYVRDLRLLNAAAIRAGGLPLAHVELAHAHLNGRPGTELRSTLAISDLRRIGAFFTGGTVADEIVRRVLNQGTLPETLLDHACGSGDLLLAAARHLPIGPDLESTLSQWGTVLHGVDIIPEFIEATHERLMLLALMRGARVTAKPLRPVSELLPNVVVGNGRYHRYLPQVKAVLLNPPYGLVKAPSRLDWASGQVTDAALWTASTLEEMQDHATLVALLPDVLRSGSRYAKWRTKVAANADILNVRNIGQFDALTDVDVFLLTARLSRNTVRQGWPELAQNETTLGDTFSVMVGPVVHLRDPHDGPLVPYITTRNLPQGGEARPTSHRQYAKRLFEPPFVVIRRTSRPTIAQARLRPVLIHGEEPIAVENHLIVIQPPDSTVASCRELSEFLVSKRVTEWLNERIRTRHLTVSAIREIPFDRGGTRPEADLQGSP